YVPQIALMSREPSDEARGFEVAFPCQTGDVDAFSNAARKVAAGFDVLPRISGRKVEFATFSTVMEDPGLWKLVKLEEGYSNTGTAYAKQGGVVYPIDANAIAKATDAQRAVLSSPFFINFPIGDLEIAANREALGARELQ